MSILLNTSVVIAAVIESHEAHPRAITDLAGIQGGTVYDAVLLKNAAKAKVDRVYTLNLKHFQAIAKGDLAANLFAP